MATGENFIRISSQNSEAMKRRLIVDKKTEQKINAQIKELQNERDLLYDDDEMSDEELSVKSQELTNKIHGLIDSMYETKEQAMKRFYGSCK